MVFNNSYGVSVVRGSKVFYCDGGPDSFEVGILKDGSLYGKPRRYQTQEEVTTLMINLQSQFTPKEVRSKEEEPTDLDDIIF